MLGSRLLLLNAYLTERSVSVQISFILFWLRGELEVIPKIPSTTAAVSQILSLDAVRSNGIVQDSIAVLPMFSLLQNIPHSGSSRCFA
jgi:hypothetical protein